MVWLQINGRLSCVDLKLLPFPLLPSWPNSPPSLVWIFAKIFYLLSVPPLLPSVVHTQYRAQSYTVKINLPWLFHWLPTALRAKSKSQHHQGGPVPDLSNLPFYFSPLAHSILATLAGLPVVLQTKKEYSYLRALALLFLLHGMLLAQILTQLPSTPLQIFTQRSPSQCDLALAVVFKM